MSAVVLGVLGGSGNDELPGLAGRVRREVQTPYGPVEVTQGELAGTAVVHVSRHGPGHVRLSNSVEHHANIAALRQLQVTAAVGLTVCGSLVDTAPPGSLIVFDDLYFPSNRLPDGRLCTWYATPGDLDRGHWIFDAPYSAPLRQALLHAAPSAGVPVVDHGVYGHVDGPRFNTRAEVATLRAAGVTAISQTAGPETVLAGEAELPYAILGFVTDHANGISEPEPVEALLVRMAGSAAVFAAVLTAAAPELTQVTAPGVVHRFGR